MDVNIPKINVEQESLFNFREIGVNGTKKLIRRRSVYRSSTPLGLNRQLTPESAVEIAEHLQKTRQIKTIIDLREEGSQEKEEFNDILQSMYKQVHHKEAKQIYSTPVGLDTTTKTSSELKRISIPLVSGWTKFGFFMAIPWNVRWRIMKAFLSGNDKAKKAAIGELMSNIGLIGTNHTLLQYSKEEIKQVLRIISDHTNHPVMFHCQHGKDRTGLISALILGLCDYSTDDIADDYALSATYLSPIKETVLAEFDALGMGEEEASSPPHVMYETLTYIRNNWGSCAEYLESIGFTYTEQLVLVHSLLEIVEEEHCSKEEEHITKLKKAEYIIKNQRSQEDIQKTSGRIMMYFVVFFTCIMIIIGFLVV